MRSTLLFAAGVSLWVIGGIIAIPLTVRAQQPEFAPPPHEEWRQVQSGKVIGPLPVELDTPSWPCHKTIFPTNTCPTNTCPTGPASCISSCCDAFVHQPFLTPLNYRTAPGVALPWRRAAPVCGPVDQPACEPVCCEDRWLYDFNALGRAYYINDQRVEWSGQEATFGVEGILAGGLKRRSGDIDWGVQGELFLTQPFDPNILADTAERVAYRPNFLIDPVDISQLYLHFRWGGLLVAAGKMITPFGRTYFPLYLNDLSDAPFIRTESILWRETGVLTQYQWNNWTAAAAVTNGSVDRDTNSSKALVARFGYDGSWFAAGASVKRQDGVGSEGQKTFNNHAGVDVMVRNERFVLSGEAIYDQYGLRRPGLGLNDITWGRSIYYRELNNGWHHPIDGVGYYVNFGYLGDLWTMMFNYGEFYPEAIGHRLHDLTTRRAIVKFVYHVTPHLQAYSMYLWENDAPFAQANRIRRGQNYLFGVQAAL